MSNIKSKVGLEAEFLLFNEKGEMIVPPGHWDRDGFPLLGEIRGKSGETVAEVVTNFEARRMQIMEELYDEHTIRMLDVARVPLKLYREANRQVKAADKEHALAGIKNIYGTDITEFSDQIVEPSKIKSAFGMKIQGIRVSCGLHIHFSCGVEEEWRYEKHKYERVILPLGLSVDGTLAEKNHRGKFNDEDLKMVGEIIQPSLYLYRDEGYSTEKEIKLYASRLNKPAIEYIVRSMDEAFFDRFAPKEEERTKFRQPGFFELKPYGFEYRSLPANRNTMDALPEITKKAFALLKEINEF